MQERPPLESFGEVLTTVDLGRVMGRGVPEIRRMARDGEIPSHQFGSRTVFYKRELLKYFSGEWQPPAQSEE